MRAFLIVSMLLAAGHASAQEAPAADALPSLAECQSTSGEGEYLACLDRLNARLDDLTKAALQTLSDYSDDYSGEAAETYEAEVAKLGPSAEAEQAAWCAVKTFESRDGTGYGSILASCLFDEKLAFLKKIQAFNALP